MHSYLAEEMIALPHYSSAINTQKVYANYPYVRPGEIEKSVRVSGVLICGRSAKKR